MVICISFREFINKLSIFMPVDILQYQILGIKGSLADLYIAYFQCVQRVGSLML